MIKIQTILVTILITVSSVKAQVCSNTNMQLGTNTDTDPEFCDTYYSCLTDGSSVRMSCGSGTFYDPSLGNCNYISKTFCPLAQCNASTEGRRLRSGRCCNQYYECIRGIFEEKTCPEGQVFSNNNCVRSQVCMEGGATLLCSVSLNYRGPCTMRPDPAGSVCYYMNGMFRMRVSAGTFWNQTLCSQQHSNVLCNDDVRNAESITTESAICNEVFLASFNDGRQNEISSPRQGGSITSDFPSDRSVSYMNNAVYFANGANEPHVYFYYFNNKEIMQGTAYRLRFTLEFQENDFGTQYTLLSNAFSSLCRESLFFSVSASSRTSRTVRAQFRLGENQFYETFATINLQSEQDALELIVIYGAGRLHGEVREMNANTIIQRVNLRDLAIPNESIKGNKCGLVLGNSWNRVPFVGSIDEFAFYDFCTNINDVLL